MVGCWSVRAAPLASDVHVLPQPARTPIFSMTAAKSGARPHSRSRSTCAGLCECMFVIVSAVLWARRSLAVAFVCVSHNTVRVLWVSARSCLYRKLAWRRTTGTSPSLCTPRRTALRAATTRVTARGKTNNQTQPYTCEFVMNVKHAAEAASQASYNRNAGTTASQL